MPKLTDEQARVRKPRRPSRTIVEILKFLVYYGYEIYSSPGSDSALLSRPESPLICISVPSWRVLRANGWVKQQSKRQLGGWEITDLGRTALAEWETEQKT